ncbi:MAG: LysM peptidoglycan-binding domain-containing M23 family metallopeptidase [Bdellovibrionota bacterium]
MRFFNSSLLLLILSLWGCRTTSVENNKVLFYKVRLEKGDTLSALATKYDTSWQEIVRLNRLGNNPTIYAGQVIILKPGSKGLSPSAMINEPATKDLDLDGVSSKQKSAKRSGLFFGDRKDFGWHWPTRGKITSDYGWRRGRMHYGIDIGADKGTKVIAAKSGVIEFSGWKKGYGRTVIIKHENFRTLYGHCSILYVKKNQVVSAGQIIARVGRSGNARGAHLHFEVRDKKNKPLDPNGVMSVQSLSSL